MLGLGSSLITPGGVSEIIPSEISGLQIWYKNNTDVAVGQWNDSSGNGRHAVQGTGDQQASVSNGGLHFDVTDPEDFYNVTESTGYVDFSGSNDFTIAAVVKRDAGTAADDHALLGGSGNNAYITFFSEEVVAYRASGALASQFTFSSNTWEEDTQFLITIQKDTSGNFTFYKNGVAVSPSSSTNVPNTASTFDVRFLACRDDGTANSGGDFQFDGIIYEIAVYDTKLTGGDITALNNYLTSKFSL